MGVELFVMTQLMTLITGICDEKDIDTSKKQSQTIIELLSSDDGNHSYEDTSLLNHCSPSSAVKQASSVDTSLLKGNNPSFFKKN